LEELWLYQELAVFHWQHLEELGILEMLLAWPELQYLSAVVVVWALLQMGQLHLCFDLGLGCHWHHWVWEPGWELHLGEEQFLVLVQGLWLVLGYLLVLGLLLVLGFLLGLVFWLGLVFFRVLGFLLEVGVEVVCYWVYQTLKMEEEH
jgi:hypothetical protein